MRILKKIYKPWKAILNIGRKHHSHYLDVQRNALLNAFAFLAIVLSSTAAISYYLLGFRIYFTPIPMIVIGLLVLWFNKTNKLVFSKNLAFFGSLVMVLSWSFYTRRTGAPLLLIPLAGCCTSIYTNRKTIFATLILCSIAYFGYQYYDHVVPFVPNPNVNYKLFNAIFSFITAGFTFFQVLLYVELTYNFSKSLDKKYLKLNLMYEKQKRTEETLQISNDKLLEFNKKLDFFISKSNEEIRSYQTAINDNLYSATISLDGRITKINNRYLEATKYSREAVIGKKYRIFYANLYPEAFYTEINEKLETGKVWRGETQQQAKDGSLIWISSSILPILDKKKTLLSYFVISYDITDKKQAEEKEKGALMELTKSENRLSLLLQNQTDLIVIRNGEGVRKYVNQAYCTFFGIQKKYFIGTNYNKQLRQSDFYIANFEQLSFENPKVSFQEVLTNTKNQNRWIKWDGMALFDAFRNKTEVLSVGHDITELKEREFQNANYIAQFEEMAFKNSHKFRSPLSNIIGILGLFESDEINLEEAKEMNDWIKNAVVDLDQASLELTSFIHLRRKEQLLLNNEEEKNHD